MTAAVERGRSTFIFHSHRRELAGKWSSIAVVCPFFIEDGNLFDGEHKKVATYFEISSPHELEKLQSLNEESENVVVNLLNWQRILLHDSRHSKTVFAISNSCSEAQIFLEAMEHGLRGVVLKNEDFESTFQLKDYLDRRDEEGSLLELIKARGDKDNETYSILLQNAETVALVASPEEGHQCTSFPVTSLKVGHEILVRVQRGARHTGIEIFEFMVEK